MKISKRFQRGVEKYQLLKGQEGEFTNWEEGKCNHFNYRKNDGTIKYIIQHHTRDDLERRIEVFTLRNDKPVSSHYVITNEGLIEQFVDPYFRAYQAGVGKLQENSKLNPGLFNNNDMNSWSIGIDTVNNGKEPFNKVQIESNILLCQKLCDSFPSIDPKFVIGHSDWSPGRKIDPSIYFPWKVLANAKAIYEDSDHIVTRNFGVFPRKEKLDLIKEPLSIILNGEFVNFNGKNEQIEELLKIQKLLQKYGYFIPEQESGVLGEYTKKVLASYNIHFNGERMVECRLEDWNKVWENRKLENLCFFAQFNENDFICLEDVIDQI